MSISGIENSTAWPAVMAKKLRDTLTLRNYSKGRAVKFQVGFSPSGPPHIGTCAEVIRTAMVMKAYEELTGNSTRLICLSDNLDGMKSLPKGYTDEHLDMPLCLIDDIDAKPRNVAFSKQHEDALHTALAPLNISYELVHSSALYDTPRAQYVMNKILKHYDQIMEVILPTLGEDRRATYSPILPICPHTRKVLYVPTTPDYQKKTISYTDKLGKRVRVKVTPYNVKLQWKVDLPARWVGSFIDFEMYGKDHADSTHIYNRICKILGGTPPVQMPYELFLDSDGSKISKSSGNGLTTAMWLNCATPQSLLYYIYKNPNKAKKFEPSVIPKIMDEYNNALYAFSEVVIGEDFKYNSPIHYCSYFLSLPEYFPISYDHLINLIGASMTTDEEVILKYIYKTVKCCELGYRDDEITHFKEYINYAIQYFYTFIYPTLTFKAPSDSEKRILTSFANEIENYNSHIENVEHSSQLNQSFIFNFIKKNNLQPAEFFKSFYEVVFGSSSGPRLGTFMSLYGNHETSKLILSTLASHDEGSTVQQRTIISN
ncbi:MAG: lysine--tRNA ligase [Gammaproteobacteria bacterium]|nr:lysine--tRNA ligase [Gammaproteobacteria bacterium]